MFILSSNFWLIMRVIKKWSEWKYSSLLVFKFILAKSKKGLTVFTDFKQIDNNSKTWSGEQSFMLDMWSIFISSLYYSSFFFVSYINISSLKILF